MSEVAHAAPNLRAEGDPGHVAHEDGRWHGRTGCRYDGEGERRDEGECDA